MCLWQVIRLLPKYCELAPFLHRESTDSLIVHRLSYVRTIVTQNCESMLMVMYCQYLCATTNGVIITSVNNYNDSNCSCYSLSYLARIVQVTLCTLHMSLLSVCHMVDRQFHCTSLQHGRIMLHLYLLYYQVLTVEIGPHTRTLYDDEEDALS